MNMTKTSKILVAAGVIILAVIAYFVFKPQPQNNSGTASTSTQTQTTTAQMPKEIVFTYNSKTPYQPKTVQVNQGDQVIIKVTSDIADEAHFHGYNLMAELTPNKEGDINFTAKDSGSFEIELENHKLTLGFIEVLPK